MKVLKFFSAALIASVGYFVAMPLAPVANAAGFVQSCVPIGNGWAHCTVQFCTEEGCVLVDSYDRPIPEAPVVS